MAKAKKRVDNKENGIPVKKVVGGHVFEVKGLGDSWHSGPCVLRDGKDIGPHWHTKVETSDLIARGFVSTSNPEKG